MLPPAIMSQSWVFNGGKWGGDELQAGNYFDQRAGYRCCLPLVAFCTQSAELVLFHIGVWLSYLFLLPGQRPVRTVAYGNGAKLLPFARLFHTSYGLQLASLLPPRSHVTQRMGHRRPSAIPRRRKSRKLALIF